jgi:hypothetical protein
MDKGKEQTVEWLEAQTPGVAAQVTDKRVKLSDGWLDECRRYAMREGGRRGPTRVRCNRCRHACGHPLCFETLTFEDRLPHEIAYLSRP